MLFVVQGEGVVSYLSLHWSIDEPTQRERGQSLLLGTLFVPVRGNVARSAFTLTLLVRGPSRTFHYTMDQFEDEQRQMHLRLLSRGSRPFH